MSEQESVVFYPGKSKLIPIAFNIAVVPMLLYFSGLWPWPPTPLHIVVFVLTAVVAVKFISRSIKKPRLIFDNDGIHCGGISYPAESVISVQPYMRALRIKFNKGDREKEKVINLWWASKKDIRKIYETAAARYKFSS